MASNFLLKIDGITGESTVDDHKGEIEVSSCSFGFTNSGSMSHGTGGGSAKASLQDIHFTKVVDSSSNAIQKIGFGGTPPKTATLFVGKQGQGDKQVYYMKVTLEELLVSSYQVSGSGDGALSESFSLNFAKYKFEYAPQKKDGSLEGFKSVTYDQKTAKTG